ASAKDPSTDAVAFQMCAERGRDVSDGSSQFDRAPGNAGLHHGQIMFVGKIVDRLQIFRVSTTRGGELFPTQIAAVFRKTSAQEHGSLARFAISGAGAAATNQDSNFDSLIGIKSAGDLRA